uniref:Uncharacterized protein n=1 Tax=Glossina pallidipes TaxID=7398 RepID=A0A1A9ZVH6_GLOPL
MLIKPTVLQSPRTTVNTTTSTTTTTATSPTTTITCSVLALHYYQERNEKKKSRAAKTDFVRSLSISREYTHDYNAIQQNLTLYTLQLVTQILMLSPGVGHCGLNEF